jgi:hypothetical protein
VISKNARYSRKLLVISSLVVEGVLYTFNFAHDQEDGPITVIVTRTAKKGRIKEFEDWTDRIVH